MLYCLNSWYDDFSRQFRREVSSRIMGTVGSRVRYKSWVHALEMIYCINTIKQIRIKSICIYKLKNMLRDAVQEVISENTGSSKICCPISC
jgi:hypothetical protein